MDPFNSSPAQNNSFNLLLGSDPGSVLNGGQTPASISSSFAQGLFGGQTPASTSGNLLNGPGSVLNGPGSVLNGPGSVLNGPSSVLGVGSTSFFNHPLLSGAGPGSVMTGGPASVLNSHNGPSSVLSGFDRPGGPGSTLNLSSLAHNSNLNSQQYNEPASVSNNLAIPMTPLNPADLPGNSVPNISAPLKTPATPLSVAHIDIPSPTLQNIVSTVNLGVALDLKKIALRARNAEYNPKRFAAVIMRIREPRTTALIFSSGKMVCTGAKSEETSRLAARKYARIVQKLGFEAKFTEFKVQNMVGSCDVRFPIQLEALFITHSQFSTYEPELFPGLIYRMVKPRVVLLIFVSGKVVITGAKYKREIDDAFNQIYPILKGFKK